MTGTAAATPDRASGGDRATVDVVVIGAGTSGLVAAIRLAQAGLRVQVLAAGHGCLTLAPGVVDVLGDAPERVGDPARALDGFVAAHGDHPYAHAGRDGLERALAWFRETVAPLGYVGALSHNRLLPTAIGGLRPSCLVPRTMAAGDLSAGGEVLVVGFHGLRDFHPALVAANLRAAVPAPGNVVAARAATLEWPGPSSDGRPLTLARRLEDPSLRAAVARDLRGVLGDEPLVGMPAVLGVDRWQEVWEGLQDAAERPVFEIPLVPPSIPGLRLFDLLRRALRTAGGRLEVGTPVTGARQIAGQVEAVTVARPPREEVIPARWVVLATGGIGSGGLQADPDGTVREPILGLPVHGLPVPGDPWTLPDYFASHPVDRAGLAVDDAWRPIDRAGRVVASNLHAVGAALVGCEPWREQSGEGISIASGYLAASAILERAG